MLSSVKLNERNMNLSVLTPHLLHQFKSEHDLIKAIEELSVKFTQDRNRISDYLKDERLTSAYVAFYFTTNLPKLQAVMEWLPKDWKERVKSSALIDVGSGPGTFSVAFREWVNAPVSLKMIETSQVMQKQAKKIFDGLYAEENLENGFSEKEKFMLFGHSANEMGPDAALKYVSQYDPQDILFIEPGTKDFFPKMLKIREALIKKGYSVIFPCPLQTKCPLENSTEDWCHQFIKVSHSVDVERLTQLVKKDRRNMPLTVFGFSKTPVKNPSSRILRILPETKFSFEWDVCHLNQAQHYQLMKKSLSKNTLKDLSSIKAGDTLNFKVVSEHQDYKRVTIDNIDNDPIL